MIRTLLRCTQFKRKTSRTKRRKREEIKMMKRELKLEELELVNGGDAKEVVVAILEFFFGGMAEESKNDVPHPHE